MNAIKVNGKNRYLIECPRCQCSKLHTECVDINVDYCDKCRWVMNVSNASLKMPTAASGSVLYFNEDGVYWENKDE